MSDRYSFGQLVEINSHSLFSKWFSEVWLFYLQDITVGGSSEAMNVSYCIVYCKMKQECDSVYMAYSHFKYHEKPVKIVTGRNKPLILVGYTYFLQVAFHCRVESL